MGFDPCYDVIEYEMNAWLYATSEPLPWATTNITYYYPTYIASCPGQGA
jgi:hypothetical protein